MIEPSEEQLPPIDDALAQNLLAGIIGQAVLDLRSLREYQGVHGDIDALRAFYSGPDGKLTKAGYQRVAEWDAGVDAQVWLESPSRAPWSFDWCCTSLGLDSHMIYASIEAGTFSMPQRSRAGAVELTAEPVESGASWRTEPALDDGDE